MARTHSPRLVRPDLVHDTHFAGQIGIQTPATIGQRQGELAAEKQQLTKAPAVGGSQADTTAQQSLLTTLHQSGVITDQTEAGYIDSPIYHDVNAGTAIGVSETIDVSMEVRRYNAGGGTDIVVTLPPVADVPPGKIFTFHRNDDSGAKVTITAAGAEVIDNRPTYILMGHNSCITIMSTQFTDWIIVSRADGDARWLETVTSIGQPLTTGGLAANTAYFTRVQLVNPLTVWAAVYALGATGGAFNVDIGIYYSDGTTMTRLGSMGSHALGGINAISKTALTAQTHLYPGFDYFVGLVCDSATPLFYKFVGTSLVTQYQNQTIAFTAAFPLPATLTIASGVPANNQPWIALEGV